MAELILHNTLSSDAAISKSVKGANGSKTGGSFAPCRFGDGFEVDANSEYVDFTGTILDVTKGTAEFWYRPSFDYTTTNTCALVSRRTSSSYYMHLIWYKGGGDAEGYFRFVIIGGTGSSYVDLIVPFDANDVLHVAYVWDATGIGGSADKTRVYVHNLTKGKIYQGAGDNVAHSSTLTDIRVGNRSNNDNAADGIIENIKIYDFAKTDFDDREYQYYPPSGFGQQFLHKYRTAGINKGTTYLSGKSVEVDMPEPNHYWKLNEISGDKIVDYGMTPIDGINRGGNSPDIIERALRFGGSSTTYDKVEIQATADEFNLSKHSMSASVWFKTDNITSNDSLIQYGGTWGTGSWQINVMTGGASGAIRMFYYAGQVTADNDIIIPNIDDGAWHHLAGVYNRYTTEVAIYFDGALVHTAVCGGAAQSLSSSQLHLGGRDDGEQFDGSIKNVRLYRDILLNDQQVLSIYEEELAEIPRDGIPQPNHQYDLNSLIITDKGKGSLIFPNHKWGFDETKQSSKAIDSGTNPVTGTLTNITTDQEGKRGRSCSFNGTNSEVSFADNSDWDLGSNDFTIAWWRKFADLQGAQIARRGAWATGYQSFVLALYTAGEEKCYFDDNDATPWAVVDKSFGIPILDKWDHLAITRSGNIFTMYKNGEVVNTFTSSVVLNNVTSSMYFGRYDTSFFEGNLDDVNWFNDIALSQAEIIDVMNGTDPRRIYNGIPSATPPALVYDEEMGNVLSFDGTNNEIVIDTVGGYWDKLGISLWVKPESSQNTYAGIIGNHWHNSEFNGFALQQDNTNTNYYYFLYGNVSGWVMDAAPRSTFYLSPSEWHHVVIVKEYGLFEVYIDGEIVVMMYGVVSGQNDPIYMDSAIGPVPIQIGDGYVSNRRFNGKIKDVRIWRE